LPILFVVFNNAAWVAVMKATEIMYPDGYSSRSNRMPLVELQPLPAFEKVIEAWGGYGERVETLDSLGPALERARSVAALQNQANLFVIR
jgi:acetolactate synthase-1/2/3 large subunit